MQPSQENLERILRPDHQQLPGKFISVMTILALVFLMSINSILSKEKDNELQKAMNSSNEAAWLTDKSLSEKLQNPY